MARHPTLPVGTRLGPYTVVSPLGAGSSAVVYLAKRGERSVALKVRPHGDPELDRRFLREFEAMRTLAVQGVVRVYDAGVGGDWLWYAMDIVAGEPIRTWIEGGGDIPGRVARLLAVAPPLCDAIAGIHRAGLVHRDLKPSNVLVDRQGQPHVLDFGVVRWWSGGEAITRAGGLVGTLPFMAPEQIAGCPVTDRADVFALGLLLWEGIAGKRPRPAAAQDWLRIQCMERPAPLACRWPEVPLDVSHVLSRMTALDPMDRPDAAEAAALFRACARGDGPEEWPEAPVYVGSPPAMTAAEDVLRGKGPRLLVIAGPAGSGRGRACEQFRRRGLLMGVRSVRGRCRVERPGSALGEVLAALLGTADEKKRRSIAGTDAAALLEMWPQLPLETEPGVAPDVASEDRLVAACADALGRAAGEEGLLVVIEGLDEVDRLTGRVLTQLARSGPANLGIVATLDDRFAGRRAQKLVATLLEEKRAARVTLPDLTADEALTLARSLVPPDTVLDVGAGSPQRATEAGLAALASLRGLDMPTLPSAAFPAALEPRPMSRTAWAALLGRDSGVSLGRLEGSGALRISGNERATLRDEALRDWALTRTAHRAADARRLAAAWEADLSPARHGARARALLLADDTEAAFEPAVLAALDAERLGRYREAGDWLLLVDTLPRDRESEAYKRLRATLAWGRAAVAARTGSERPRPDLVAQAIERAETREDRIRASLLHADLLRREGDLAGALAVCLKQANRFVQAPGHPLALAAWTQAAELRLEMGQPDEAVRHLDTAETDRGGRQSDLGQLRIDEVRAGALLAGGDPTRAVTTCEAAITLAGRLGGPRGALYLSLAEAWSLLGERARAEEAALASRRLFVETGERAAAATAAALCGSLALGRGDPAAAAHFAQEAQHVARRLNLRQLLARALTLALEVATVRGDEETGARCVAEAERLGTRNAAFSVAELRWWRSLGEYDRALLAADPETRTGFRGAELELELARLRVAIGDAHKAGPHLKRGLDLAHDGGFRELQLYARVIRGEVEAPTRSDGWALTFADASASRWAEIFLYVLRVDGRRRAIKGDVQGARSRWLELLARAEEHGNRPYVHEAKTALATLG